ncbi:glycosyl hydrolase 53 family protein [Frankia sp. CNm7]|uniref:glycoside hydrolase family 53 protein n=1 Tax=Frankia nepalensis TaxID=1836974 RepID=UPI0019328FB2|nr:glycosyl hydrolase 53 family protein [Frankia nepalensis]MBL7518251.1 glycosyl hydrolase 53 family protein [Frankia nepalensis]
MLSVRGVDLSTALLAEAAGIRYSAGGAAEPIERILADVGANYVRLRLWVNPPAGYGDEASALALARRAAAAGMKIFLDFHYSDTWADPKHQTTPAAWRGDDLEALATRVRDYTRRVVADFARQGTPADLVQVGNEISNGMLWPLGRLTDGQPGGWPGFLALVRAGVDGARDGGPAGHRPRIALHSDRVGDPAGSHTFFDRLTAAGIPFDVIALSYYPFWHGPLDALRATMDDLARRYRGDVLVAETGYPWTMAGGDPVLGVADPDRLPEASRFPPTPEGQRAYFGALREVIRQVPDGRGLGFVAWEPGWLAGVGWEPGATAPFTNLTLFDHEGGLLPAARAAFAPPGS